MSVDDYSERLAIYDHLYSVGVGVPVLTGGFNVVRILVAFVRVNCIAYMFV